MCVVMLSHDKSDPVNVSDACSCDNLTCADEPLLV